LTFDPKLEDNCHFLLLLYRPGGFMKASTQPRKTVNLPKALQHQLNAYALAASAGVAALCSAPPAQAKVIYTPAHVKIPPKSELFIDLDRDGIADFGLRNSARVDMSAPYASLRVIPQQPADGVWATTSTSRKIVCAAALPKGKKVRAGRNFQHGGSRYFNSLGLPMDFYASFVYGPWSKVKQAYLGFQFVILGSTHYGWARVRIDSQSPTGISATLTGYAYEDVPNKPITTGATEGPDVVVGSDALGHLAAGSSAPHKILLRPR
jgi:hypothetical protein